jgi:hypothetical protein
MKLTSSQAMAVTATGGPFAVADEMALPGAVARQA